LRQRFAISGWCAWDTICIQPFGATGDSFVSGGGRHRFIPAVNFLQNLKPSGRTNYFQIARQFMIAIPAARSADHCFGFSGHT